MSAVGACYPLWSQPFWHAAPALSGVPQDLDTAAQEPQPKSRSLTTEKEAHILAALKERLWQRAIARTFGVSRDTIRELLKNMKQIWRDVCCWSWKSTTSNVIQCRQQIEKLGWLTSPTP